MQKNILVIALIVLVIVVGILTLRFFSGSEDTWICENGSWVKHGVPSGPMPTSGCGEKTASINSFDQCVLAGYGVMESYPEKCAVPGGKTFTRDIGNELELADKIAIDEPRPNARVTSPLWIRGEAVGNWFFEADFPVRLEDEEGNLISEGFAATEDDWMTEDFVSYSVKLEFDDPEAE